MGRNQIGIYSGSGEAPPPHPLGEWHVLIVQGPGGAHGYSWVHMTFDPILRDLRPYLDVLLTGYGEYGADVSQASNAVAVKSFGSLLVAVAALATVVRLIVVFAGTNEAFGTSSGWELLMVVLMGVALVHVLATGFVDRARVASTGGPIQDPAAVRFLFTSPESASFWTVVRLYVGFAWFQAGYGKVIGKEGDWMTNGTALKGFWSVVPALNHKGQNAAPAYNWWYDFLDFMNKHEWYTWFAKVIALGETAVGVALMIGLFVGTFRPRSQAIRLWDRAVVGAMVVHTCCTWVGGRAIRLALRWM